ACGKLCVAHRISPWHARIGGFHRARFLEGRAQTPASRFRCRYRLSHEQPRENASGPAKSCCLTARRPTSPPPSSPSTRWCRSSARPCSKRCSPALLHSGSTASEVPSRRSTSRSKWGQGEGADFPRFFLHSLTMARPCAENGKITRRNAERMLNGPGRHG